MRRIEGTLLHPVQDWRGVYRFDVDDVEALVHDIASGEASLWVAMGNESSPQPADFDVARVHRKRELRTPDAHDKTAPTYADEESIVARLKDENAALRTVAHSACSLAIEVCSPAQLRAVGPQLHLILLELGEE